MTTSRYHIHTNSAPPPPGGYPADFLIAAGDAYIKYGHVVFEGRTQRGDDYWTAEIITQTWYQAETGRIPGLVEATSRDLLDTGHAIAA